MVDDVIWSEPHIREHWLDEGDRHSSSTVNILTNTLVRERGGRGREREMEGERERERERVREREH